MRLSLEALSVNPVCLALIPLPLQPAAPIHAYNAPVAIIVTTMLLPHVWSVLRVLPVMLCRESSAMSIKVLGNVIVVLDIFSEIMSVACVRLVLSRLHAVRCVKCVLQVLMLQVWGVQCVLLAL